MAEPSLTVLELLKPAKEPWHCAMMGPQTSLTGAQAPVRCVRPDPLGVLVTYLVGSK